MARRVDIPTEKRVRRWAISLKELLSDPTGVREFELYLQKEYSGENLRFWQAVQKYKRGSQRDVTDAAAKINESVNTFGVYDEILNYNYFKKLVLITWFQGTFVTRGILRSEPGQ